MRIREHPAHFVKSFYRSGVDFGMTLLDALFTPLQRLLGPKRIPYLFVLPNLLIFGIFIIVPMFLNVFYALTGGNSFLLADRTWVGLKNFSQLFSCGNFLDPNSCKEDLFWRAVYNTAFYVVAQVSLTVIMSLITALALNRGIKARGFFRGVFFYPVLLSPVVVALIWKWILQDQGVLNGVLTGFGLGTMPFLENAGSAKFWVVIISVWAYMGFYTLILLAGLQAIPKELYEAGNMDGINDFQAFRYITLPLLRPTAQVVLLLAMIRAVQIFDLIYAFTGGGPGTATLFLVQYIYQNGFASAVKRLGIASSASLLMGGVLILLTILQLSRERGKH